MATPPAAAAASPSSPHAAAEAPASDSAAGNAVSAAAADASAPVLRQGDTSRAEAPNLTDLLQVLADKYRVEPAFLASLQHAIGMSRASGSVAAGGPAPEVAALGALGSEAGLGVAPSPLASSLLSFDVYERLYSRLCLWIFSVFSDCREELLDVAFAVLLHMFKKLLGTDVYQARQLLRRFASLHTGKHQPLLKQIEETDPVHPLQLRQIPFFASDERHPLFISERAYFVLRTWLLDTRCLLLEVIIQAAVRLLPPPAHAPHLRGIFYRGLLLASPSAVPARAPPAPAASSGFASFLPLAEPRRQEGDAGGAGLPKRLEKAEGARQGDETEALPPVTWGLPRQFFREESTVLGPSGERTNRVRIVGGENLRESDLADPNALLPLPEPSKDAFLFYKRAQRQQLERRVTLSASAGQLPSIACMTVLNSSCETASCAVSPSSARLVAVGGEGEIRLWDLQQYQVSKARRERRRRRCLLRMQQQAQEAVPLSSASSFSLDDEAGAGDARQASSDSDEEAPNRTRKRAEAARPREDTSVARGSSLAPSALDWADEDEAEAGVSRLVGCDGRVLALAFGEADDRVLLSGGVDGVVRLWQSFSSVAWTSGLDDDAEEEEGSLKTPRQKAERDSRAADGRGATEDAEEDARLQDIGQKTKISGSNVVSPLCVYRGALAAVWSLDVGPYGHYFASGSSDNCARLWCTSRSFPLRLLQHPAAAADVFRVAFHPNSSLLLTAASDETVRLFDLRSAQVARAWRPLLLPAPGEDGRREREDRRGREQALRDVEKREKALPMLKKKRLLEEAKGAAARSVSLRGGGRRECLSEDEDERWRLEERRKRGKVTALALSPSGRLVATGDSAGGVCVFDIPSGRPLAFGWSPALSQTSPSGSPSASPICSSPRIYSLSFCYGSSLLASAAADGTVALWDTSCGALKTPPDGEDSGRPGALFEARPLPSLALAETYGAAHVAMRACVFTPQNLLLCLGFSTLASDGLSF
ncbi:transcription initiation factor TFIID subunit TAF5 [Besnoitia besnoiti]|uniref:Transcription initiation factor TFIID subunit TAF5 n=1 Tax=Besnoitia besnoiti TaxID=94643 RepID=A0A2A9MJ82_BESBE|nr:transcription initiation factor TFIID subunit TAF5 [Besnoitia besnoiti]PFH36311.1 transcription initiation factor TFIID subunit TAF5 [Besnoitia besnoiti]